LTKDKNVSFQFLTQGLRSPRKISKTPAMNFYLLKACGLNVRSSHLEMWYNYSDLYRARSLLKNFDNKRIKIIAGIGSSGARYYPVEKYLIAFQKIVEKGAAIVILGGPKETKGAKYLQENLPADSVLNLVELNLGWRVEAAVMSLADMYIGNFTGACDAASATHLPSICLSREAKNKSKDLLKISEYVFNFPWQTAAIVLQPKQPLGECARFLNVISFSTCRTKKNEPHCITQIEPQEIVQAFDKMLNFIKTAKKFGGFPVLQNIKPVTASNTLAKFKRQKGFEIFQKYSLVAKQDCWKIEDSNYSFVKEGTYWTIR